LKKYSSNIFQLSKENKVNISLPSLSYQSKNPWLNDAIDFSKECFPLIKSFKNQGPIVISGLPVDFCISLSLSAWFLGRTVVFIDPDCTGNQQALIINDLKPSCWISNTPIKTVPEFEMVSINIDSHDGSDEFSQRLSGEELYSDYKPYLWAPTEAAIILFTSGSTGKPKGVCHSLQNLISSAKSFQNHFNIIAEDKVLNLAPVHTMSGLRCSIFMPLITDCDTQIPPVLGDLNSVLNAIENYPSTVLIAGPKLLETLIPISARILGLKHIRMMLSTGAPLSRVIREALWQNIKVPVYDYYGLTETSGLVIAEATNNYNPSSSVLGLPCEGVKATVIDNNGQELTEGSGLLRVYSPAIFLGYFGSTLHKHYFFDTGDNATINADKKISLQGRTDKSIKSTTTLWLKPLAIEEWLIKKTDVKDFAIKSSEGYISCYLVIKNCVLDALIENLVADLGVTYREVKWYVVDEIKRTNLSKINWNLLGKK